MKQAVHKNVGWLERIKRKQREVADKELEKRNSGKKTNERYENLHERVSQEKRRKTNHRTR